MSEATWCRLCREHRPDDGRFCLKHGEDLGLPPVEAAVLQEDTADGWTAEDPRTTCWKCGARSAHIANDACASCQEPLVPPALFMEFPAGSVVLRSGTSAVLGRAGTYGALFAAHPNVSRRHARIEVDETGQTWIVPFPEAPNGTFVNDAEVLVRSAVEAGDRIRFGTDRTPNPGPVSLPIRQPSREP
ncbi:MAG: FHA domain-containing protein [Jatrophihabitantaceae bacterium]